MRRACSVLLSSLLLVALLSCSDTTTEPGTPPEAAPSLSTAAATALAFYQVSGGDDYSCGVTTDDRAYCWGLNYIGQLGDGTHTTRLKPVPVAGGIRFHQVSAGYVHACGVTAAYKAYCWGSNADGTLGDGTTTDRAAPVAVAGGHLFRRIDAANSHTCAVTYPDNRAYCWGYNGEGELGDGTFSYQRLTPTAVVGGRQFRQVDAGVDHTCGVTTSDEALCWGFNNYGQLGDSTNVYRRATPARVAGGRRFRQLDAGAAFTCAVATDNRAYCWGNGRSGQIGDGKPYLRFWPRAVAGGLSFSRVTTSRGAHACGETTLNRAYCWGKNRYGALGDGTTTQRLTPVAVAGGRYFSQVSAGGAHTCGKTATSEAYCWGANWSGQLGDGTTTTRLTPVRVAGG